MATIQAPFASRDYSDITHEKKIIEIPSSEITWELSSIISHAVAGFIEPDGQWITKITTIELR